MTKEMYGFSIEDHDFDDVFTGSQLMLYERKDKLLVPISSEFERGMRNFMTKEEIIENLNLNKINSIKTYQPNNQKTVCSSPYDTAIEEEFQACMADGLWYQYDHFQIFEDSSEGIFLRKAGISIIELNDNEVSTLEKSLVQHYEGF